MDKVRLGIIGLGRLGIEHANNIHYAIHNAELATICSVVPQELETVSKTLSPAYVSDDYREIIASDALDGIVIATNSQTQC